MDRQQPKTVDAIFSAFTRLPEMKRYGHITVQDIIDETGTGRSTFYANLKQRVNFTKSI